jgi:hypothetical protein
MRSAAPCTTVSLEQRAVDCTHCGVQMTSHVGSGQQVQYFHCPSCQRWSSSMYAEVFRADTKMRTRAAGADQKASFGEVRARLEHWLKSLEVKSAWQVLGCSPADCEQVIRERYLALARQHHPDRGGTAQEMCRINDAYEEIVASRERQRLSLVRALPTGR